MTMLSAPAGVKVLHKTLDIVEAIRQNPQGMFLVDVSRSVSMPKPTVFRILSTLEARGYMTRRDGGRYVLARKMFSPADPGVVDQLLMKTAPPLIERLAAASRETVNLGILDGAEVLIMHAVESPQTVRMTAKAGNRRHVHTTALGKVLIAETPVEELEQLLKAKGLPRMTRRSLATIDALIKDLRRVRRRGYAIDDQENEPEGRCVAAKIVGADRRIVAALSISAPAFRMEVRQLKQLVPSLRQTCQSISASLGGFA